MKILRNIGLTLIFAVLYLSAEWDDDCENGFYKMPWCDFLAAYGF